VETGITLMTTGTAICQDIGFIVATPWSLTWLADARRMAGQSQHALEDLAEAHRLAEATQVRIGQAETLRLRGDLQILTGDHLAAEASYHDAIALAERQSAKLFQLRASTSLTRLWRDQGRRAAAHDMLAPIYGWFTEGFNVPVLKEAKALLDDLT
jgi:predicted ATPase